MKKYIPKVGDKLYLSQRTGDYWVDMVRRPFTVVSVSENRCVVRECDLVFSGPRYYDSLPDEIRDDPNGELITLRWSEAKCRWQETPATAYPEVATFGAWDYQPYLN